MKHPGTTLYIPISADVEIALTFRARAFNGISSDPRVILRDPSLTEAMDAISALKEISRDYRRPTLDYPEA